MASLAKRCAYQKAGSPAVVLRTSEKHVRLIKLLVREVVEMLSVGVEDQGSLIKIWQNSK